VSRSDDLRLADIVDAGRELDAIVVVGRTAFLDDPIRIRAAERLLEIIGEAASALDEETRAGTPRSPGGTSPAFGSCSPTTTSGSTPSQVRTIATEDVPALVERLAQG
jgi:hypothetical protein